MNDSEPERDEVTRQDLVDKVQARELTREEREKIQRVKQYKLKVKNEKLDVPYAELCEKLEMLE